MQYVLITGAFGGMGRVVMQTLAARGYGVFALDREVDRTVPAHVIPLKADLCDAESVRRSADVVRNTTDRLYAVLHFAGVYMLDSLAEMDAMRFERIMRVNLGGAFLVNQIFLPFLSRGSKIIMTTSELAPLRPLPFTGVYAISKSALDDYAYSLRMELQLLGISVSVLRAGAVQTDMLSASTTELAKFCTETKLYKCNAARFRKIVDSVESKSIPPIKIAEKTVAILEKKSPAFAYAINRNPLLRTFDMLPSSMQFRIIKAVLK